MLTIKLPGLNHILEFSILAKPLSIALSQSLKVVRLRNLTIMSSSSKAKITVEYAKSNKSQCRKCLNKIQSKSLRVGLVTRDKERNFDMTRWHHLNCFTAWPESFTSVDMINGFTLLKGSDQDALREVAEKHASANEEVSVGNKCKAEESAEKSSKKLQVGKEDEGDKSLAKVSVGHKRKSEEESAEQSSKKLEVGEEDEGEKNLAKPMHAEKANTEIIFSVSAVKDRYKDATLKPKWKAFQTVIFLDKDDGLHDSSKIAAFDGCLAKTSVKKVGPDAWSLMYDSIPDKLQSLYNDGYKLVIFTNEANITLWTKKRQIVVDSKIGRLNNFIKRVNVPVQVFIACGSSKGDDPFRKPKPGMWQIMKEHFNSGIPIDMDQSFYVGDAAGRTNDHGAADIKFAKAIGLRFYVPEEYF